MLMFVLSYPDFIHLKLSDLPVSQQAFLKRIARDTFKYFLEVCDASTGLVYNKLCLFPVKEVQATISPFTIGLQLCVYCAGYDLGFINKQEFIERVSKILNALEQMERWNGLYFYLYKAATLQKDVDYVSSMDNAVLICGLIAAKYFAPELKQRVEAIIKDINLKVLYDPNLGQFHLGYSVGDKQYTPWHYGILCTESRLLSYIAIGLGQVPKEHYFKINRTLPAEWAWQAQTPKGEWRIYLGVKVFEGHYIYKKIKFVPSWGGGLSEFLFPTLFFDEAKWAPKSLGENNKRVVQLHIDFAKQKKLPVWGIASCSTPDGSFGGYHAFGVAFLGIKGYKHYHVIAPYASALALSIYPSAVSKNFKKFVKLGCYGEYGFYDSYDAHKKLVSPNYFAQNQAYILLSIYNYIKKGGLRKIFEKEFPQVLKLISLEEFSIF